MTTYPDCRRCLFGERRCPRSLRRPPNRCSPAPLRAVADEHGLLQEGVWRRATARPKCRRRLFAFGPGPPGCAGAAAPLPSPFSRCYRFAPLRVVADERCLPQEGVCLHSITYLQPLLGPVPDVLCDVVRPALAVLVELPAEMCGALQRYAPTDCSWCSSSSARGAAGQAGRGMVGGHAKPPGGMILSTGVKVYLFGREVSSCQAHGQ